MVRVDQGEWWAEFKIFQDRDGRCYWRLEAISLGISPVRTSLRIHLVLGPFDS